MERAFRTFPIAIGMETLCPVEKSISIIGHYSMQSKGKIRFVILKSFTFGKNK